MCFTPHMICIRHDTYYYMLMRWICQTKLQLRSPESLHFCNGCVGMCGKRLFIDGLDQQCCIEDRDAHVVLMFSVPKRIAKCDYLTGHFSPCSLSMHYHNQEIIEKRGACA